MTQTCQICTHPKRLEIDREIVSGANLSKLAQFFSVKYHSLYAHAREHVSRQLSQAMEKKNTEEAFNLLERIDQIVGRTENIFLRNYEKGKDTIALKALSEQRSTFDLLAKISYSLHQAKLAEIELARLNSGESNKEAEVDFQEKIKVLSIPELKVLLALTQKISRQDKTMDPLEPFTSYLQGITLPDQSKVDIDIHSKNKAKQIESKSNSKYEGEEEESVRMPVREIASKQIPVMSNKDYLDMIRGE